MTMDDRKKSLPLSSAQLGIWFAQKIDPANTGFSIGEWIEIHGAVNPSLCEAAIRQSVADTEASRVRLIEDGDGPRQIIDPPSAMSLPLLDVSSESDPQGAAEAWMKTDLARPVDLLRGPLWTIALFKAAPDRFFLYLRSHHIIMDGFGASLFARRVADVYTALGNELPCPESPFGSLAFMQEDDAAYRGSERFARDRQYWLERLADRPEPVSLSGRSPAKSGGFLRQTAFLEACTLEKLRTTERIARASLGSVVVAAAAAYVHRLSGAQDLMLGLPVTGRPKAASRQVPCMAANVLPLRLTVGPRVSLSELIQGVREEIFRALRHQRYRLEDMRGDLGLVAHGRSLFGPTVNVMAFDDDLRFAGHHTTTHNLSNGWPIDDLAIYVYDRSDDRGLRIDFNANPALYSVEELAQHQRRFLSLLRAIAADPGQPLGRLELLAREEREQILVKWNNTSRTLPPATLPALFEAQVQRTPETAALIFEQSAFSYGQLNAKANRLAHLLIGQGIGPETLVALALPR